MTGATFGVIGLGTMGRNLALNIESRGLPVAVWNLETEWVDDFLRDHQATSSSARRRFEELASALERPRRIMMMIPAGKPVDEMIEKIRPLLEAGDVLIDGGNSWFEDTRRREAALRPAGIHFVGCGVSGGEEGARFGPSIMPGGSAEAWARIKDVLEAIAARTEAGPCVTHVGPDGAGHFVKMVHNGIEYGDMQLIAEAYDVLRRGLGLTRPETARRLRRMESRAAGVVPRRADRAGLPRRSIRRPSSRWSTSCSDKAGQKGTGKLDGAGRARLAVAIPTIAAALDARVPVEPEGRAGRGAAQAIAGPPLAAGFAGTDRRQVDRRPRATRSTRRASAATRRGWRSSAPGRRKYDWNDRPRGDRRGSGKGAASFARGCSIQCARPSKRSRRSPTCCSIQPSATTCERAQAGWRRTSRRRRQAGIPVPRSRVGAGVFRQLSHRAAAAEPDPGAARRLRRAHSTSAPTVRASCTASGDSGRRRKNEDSQTEERSQRRRNGGIRMARSVPRMRVARAPRYV